MAHAWLDATPRRRLPIPPRDLAAGITMGLGLCVVALGLAASMKLVTEAPEEPITISIGVRHATAAQSQGGRSGGLSPSEGPRSPRETSQEPTAATVDSSSPRTPARSTRPRAKRAGVVPSLPGLGDLEDPPSEPGDGGGGASAGGAGGGGEGDGDGGDGTGAGGGTGNGALAAYRSQLAAWLSARFHVEGSGLDPRKLGALRVRASLRLSEDRVVLSYDLEPTGIDVIDEAARRALESVLGQPAPEPPPGYGAVQPKIRVTFVCRPGTCS